MRQCLLLGLLILNVDACGPNGCDPLDPSNCQKLPTHVTVTINNQTADALTATLSPSSCASGGETWAVGAHSQLAKSLTIVREGGGDPCSDYDGGLSVSGGALSYSQQFTQMDPPTAISLVCSDGTCAAH